MLHPIPAGVATTPDADMTLRQANLLRQEVSFWQDMLFSLEGADKPREFVERIHQALALAQYRLAQLQRQTSH